MYQDFQPHYLVNRIRSLIKLKNYAYIWVVFETFRVQKT
jgi:hypothetical protein